MRNAKWNSMEEFDDDQYQKTSIILPVKWDYQIRKPWKYAAV